MTFRGGWDRRPPPGWDLLWKQPVSEPGARWAWRTLTQPRALLPGWHPGAHLGAARGHFCAGSRVVLGLQGRIAPSFPSERNTGSPCPALVGPLDGCSGRMALLRRGHVLEQLPGGRGVTQVWVP